MKKSVTIYTVLILALLNCSKEKTIAKSGAPHHTAGVSSFAVDSVKVQDSVKVDDHLTLAFGSKLLVFPQITDSILLDSIYAKSQIHTSSYSKPGLAKQLETKKTEFYTETKESLKDYKPDFKQTWTNRSKMDVFSNKNGFLTVKYSGDGFTGGAHGYYYEFYKIFDLTNKKTLQLEDVLTSQDSKIWSRILMDNFLKNDLKNGQAEMLLVKEIPLNDNFYFDQDYLYFLYNQYEIAAYAAGPVLIKVPFSSIKSFLKNEFKIRTGR